MSAKVDVGATFDSAIPAGPGPVPPIPGPPPLDAVRGPRCDLTMPCMLFDTFQRLGTGFQRRDRPAPVDTKEKLLLADGRKQWLVVVSLALSLVDPYLWIFSSRHRQKQEEGKVVKGRERGNRARS